MPTLSLTGDEDADRLLSDNGFALLMGMLLDQQVAMEVAFVGPLRLSERINAPLTPQSIATADPAALEEAFRDKPALHRYPGSMAKRVQALAAHLVEAYDGHAEAVWEQAADGADLKRRLKGLPGFGDQKAQIFIALLGKQCGVTPDGWEQAAGVYADEGYRSIADVTSREALALVREAKRARKAAGS